MRWRCSHAITSRPPSHARNREPCEGWSTTRPTTRPWIKSSSASFTEAIGRKSSGICGSVSRCASATNSRKSFKPPTYDPVIVIDFNANIGSGKPRRRDDLHPQRNILHIGPDLVHFADDFLTHRHRQFDAGALKRRQLAAAHVEPAFANMNVGMAHAAMRNPQRDFVPGCRCERVLLRLQSAAPRVERPAMRTKVFHAARLFLIVCSVVIVGLTI